MPLLAAFLATLFESLAGFFALFLTRKVATVTAGVTALSAIYASAVACFNLLIAPIVGGLFATQFGFFLGLIFPPIAGLCLVAYAALWACLALHRWQQGLVKLAASA